MVDDRIKAAHPYNCVASTRPRRTNTRATTEIRTTGAVFDDCAIRTRIEARVVMSPSDRCPSPLASTAEDTLPVAPYMTEACRGYITEKPPLAAIITASTRLCAP